MVAKSIPTAESQTALKCGAKTLTVYKKAHEPLGQEFCEGTAGCPLLDLMLSHAMLEVGVEISCGGLVKPSGLGVQGGSSYTGIRAWVGLSMLCPTFLGFQEGFL